MGRSEGTPEGTPGPLGQLIAHVLRANGWGLDHVVRRARSAGYLVEASDLARLLVGAVVTIPVDTVRALAAGLGVSPHEVLVATLESLGHHVPESFRSPEERAEAASAPAAGA